jgi:hypothetical protein
MMMASPGTSWSEVGVDYLVQTEWLVLQQQLEVRQQRAFTSGGSGVVSCVCWRTAAASK